MRCRFITSADLPVLHHLLLPGLRGVSGQSCSSVLLYRIAGELRLVGAQPAGNLRFQLAVAPVMGRWTPVGDLQLSERLPDDETERLAFTPWNTGGGIRPTGPLMGLRESAYRPASAAAVWRRATSCRGT